MAEDFLSGTWLLIDAAGPTSMVGLVESGKWLSNTAEEGDFLAMLQPATAGLLEGAGLTLEDLAGTIYASGPGSTLGLRLAAMFIRSLMEMPKLAHWRCLQYHNLELAACTKLIATANMPVEAVAPWRRDRFHHVVLEPGTPQKFSHHYISPEHAGERNLTGFELGRRLPAFDNAVDWNSFPLEQIPAVLDACPDLLCQTNHPIPYVAEEPDFARWSPKRHCKP